MRQDALMALFEQLLPISREAGAAIMDIYQQEDFAARLKADASPVTAAVAGRIFVRKTIWLHTCRVIALLSARVVNAL